MKTLRGGKVSKTLADLTLEELWELFPIILTEPNSLWGEWYQEEISRIKLYVDISNCRLNHIGSTAIKDIYAKPTVDILMEIPFQMSMGSVKDSLIKGGYLCMYESNNRMDFNRGYTLTGFAERVFHLHLRYIGDNDELYFRDYMNEYHNLAKEYEKLKLSLWKKYEHDRDGYTEAKTEFVKRYTDEAKHYYKSKYLEIGE